MSRASTRRRRYWLFAGSCIVGSMLIPQIVSAALILRADHSNTPGYDVVVVDQQFRVGSRMRSTQGGLSLASLNPALTSATAANTADCMHRKGSLGSAARSVIIR